jgi:hypothetical protein
MSVANEGAEPTPRTRTVFPQLEPFAVPLDEARRLLGNKGRNQVFEAIRRGELDAVRDGNKTLITVESIRRRQAALPPIQLIEPPHLVAGKKKKARKTRSPANKPDEHQHSRP